MTISIDDTIFSDSTVTTLEKEPFSTFQEKKRQDKHFVSSLFQTFIKPGTHWISKDHLELLKKALHTLGPEEMDLSEVQTVLSAIDQSRLFHDKQFWLNTLLIDAIETENVTLVEKWIRQGAQLNGCKNEQKIAPLFYALKHNQIKIAFLLLEKGASTKFDLAWNIFCNSGDEETLLSVLYEAGEHKVTLNVIEDAVAKNSLYLLDQLSRILHLACQKGDNKLVSLLVQQGVIEYAKDQNYLSDLALLPVLLHIAVVEENK